MMPRNDPEIRPDPDDPHLAAFVAAFQEALATGAPLPDDSHLSAEQRRQWEQVKELVVLLHRTSPPGSGKPSPTFSPPTPEDLFDGVTLPLRPGTKPDFSLDADLPSVPGYQVLKKVGRGGMGVVFQARHQALNRVVALKMVLAGDLATPEQLLRFQLEAELAARVRHPNVVAVHEIGQWQGRPFLALEWVEGGTLAQKLQGTPLSPGEAAELVEVLARAVHAAHCHGVIHRDLKPANVLLASSGRTDCQSVLPGVVPRITDFGLAKSVADAPGLTTSGAIVGTPEYMAPEQAAGDRNVGPPADIYALGAILYECLTGRPPFKGTSFLETLQRVREREPDPVRSLQPKVPLDIETICLECLRKDPAGRYATAEALADDLRRFRVGEPIAARPCSIWERGWKWARRRKGIACLSAILVLVSILGAALVLWQWGRAEAANKGLRNLVREEEAARRKAEDSEADTRAFSEFLVSDVLAAARPKGSLGGVGIDVTVREALVEAVKNLPQRFEGRPRAEAEARHALGVSFRLIGNLSQAEEQLVLARKLRTELLGPDHPNTLRTMNSLAVVYTAAAKYDLAFPLLEETLQRQTALLGPDDPATLTTRSNLGHWYFVTGKIVGPDRPAGQHGFSVSDLEELLQRQKAVLGPDHPETLSGMTNLAVTYSHFGKHHQALLLLEESLQRQKVLFGQDHSETLNTLSNLGYAYSRLGKHDQALPLFEEALKGHKAVLGPHHPRTLACMSNLAGVYQIVGKPDLALPLLEESLSRQKADLGLDHPETLDTLNARAVYSWQKKRFPEAVRRFEELLAIVRRKFGDDHPRAIRAAINLAVNLQATGSLKEAEKVIDEWLPRVRSKLDPRDSILPLAVTTATSIYQQVAKSAESEPLWRDLVALSGQVNGAGSLPHAGVLSVRGHWYGRQGRWKDAAADLVEVVRIHPQEHYHWFQAAVVLAAVDPEGYRRHRREMLKRFGDQSDPTLAERTAKVCLLFPSEGEELKQVVAVVRRLTADGKPDVWGELVSALGELRRGNLVRAAELARSARPKVPEGSYPGMLAGVLEALALTGPDKGTPPGDREKALRLLAQTRQQMKGWARESKEDLGGGWLDLLICRVLLRQVEESLERKSTGK
jgi:tetratricopeptide (TPR) repeat protein